MGVSWDHVIEQSELAAEPAEPTPDPAKWAWFVLDPDNAIKAHGRGSSEAGGLQMFHLLMWLDTGEDTTGHAVARHVSAWGRLTTHVRLGYRLVQVTA